MEAACCEIAHGSQQLRTISAVTSCNGCGGLLFSAAVKENFYSLSLIDLAIYGSVLDWTQQYLLRTCLRCSYYLHMLDQIPVGNRVIAEQQFITSNDESLLSLAGRRIVPVCLMSSAISDLLTSGPSHPGGDLGRLR